MTWFRVDDAWWSHPKVVGLSLAARGLWVTAGSWCAQHLQDGKVPRTVLAMLGGTARLAAELVAAGLWTTSNEGWVVHDWHRYQPSRADVEKEREQKRNRQKKWRDTHRHVDASTAESTDKSTDGLGDTPEDTPVTAAPVRASSRPVPSRPTAADAAAAGAREDTEPDPDEDPFGPEPYAGLDGHEVARAWDAASAQGLGGNTKAMPAFAAMASTFERLERDHARLACWVYCHWVFRAPDGPVLSGRMRRVRPWSVQAGVAEDLPAAREWFNALSEAQQAEVRPPRAAPEAAQ